MLLTVSLVVVALCKQIYNSFLEVSILLGDLMVLKVVDYSGFYLTMVDAYSALHEGDGFEWTALHMPILDHNALDDETLARVVACEFPE